MYAAVRQVLEQRRQKLGDLLDGPAEGLAKDAERDALDALEVVVHLQHAEHLLLVAFCPGRRRDGEAALRDVGKARLGQPLLVAVARHDIAAGPDDS